MPQVPKVDHTGKENCDKTWMDILAEKYAVTRTTYQATRMSRKVLVIPGPA